MTTWSTTPPSEPGWYWVRPAVDHGPIVRWFNSRGDMFDGYEKKAPLGKEEYGPRIPSPEAIEAAKDALQDASGCDTFNAAPCGICVPCKARAARAKLEGR